MLDSIGHRQRIKEKFLKADSDQMLDYEILELLLTYGIPRKDVKPVAKRLLKTFKSFSGVLDAPISLLQEVEGVGEHTAMLLKVSRSVITFYFREDLYQKDYMVHSMPFFDYARAKIGASAHEIILAFFLDARNRYIYVDELNGGAPDRVQVFPCMIAKQALIHSARSVVICHNHPSGQLQPSEEDDQVTRKVRMALEQVDVKLLDHIVVCREDYFSYRYSAQTNPKHKDLLSVIGSAGRKAPSVISAKNIWSRDVDDPEAEQKCQDKGNCCCDHGESEK